MRIRTIKPEFPHSESMGRVSRDARLLFILLWTICDDAGRTRAASRLLASLLFPYDSDAPDLIDGWLAELESQGCIVRYEVDGSSYLQVTKWLKHQKIDRPSGPKYPGPDEGSRTLASPRESSCLDQGPRTKDQGSRTDIVHYQSSELSTEKQNNSASRAKRARSSPVVVDAPPDVSSDTWADFLALRRAKRAPLTQTALDGIAREASRAGLTLQAVLEMCCQRGWAGFRADWLQQTHHNRKGVNGHDHRHDYGTKQARIANYAAQAAAARGEPDARELIIDVEAVRVA